MEGAWTRMGEMAGWLPYGFEKHSVGVSEHLMRTIEGGIIDCGLASLTGRKGRDVLIPKVGGRGGTEGGQL